MLNLGRGVQIIDRWWARCVAELLIARPAEELSTGSQTGPRIGRRAGRLGDPVSGHRARRRGVGVSVDPSSSRFPQRLRASPDVAINGAICLTEQEKVDLLFRFYSSAEFPDR
jgi:hypothetical protein